MKIEIVTKINDTDSKGRAIKDTITNFTFSKYASIKSLFPFGTDQTAKTYGFTISSTHRAFTFDLIEANSYIKVKNSIYWVKETSDYGRYRALIMEKIL